MCNNLNYINWRYLQNCEGSCCCMECYNVVLLFNSLNQITKTFLTSLKKECWYIKVFFSKCDHIRSFLNGKLIFCALLLLLKPAPSLKVLVNQFASETQKHFVKRTQIRDNTDLNENSVFGHFSWSEK